MAITTSKIVDSVKGNHRVVVWDVTPGAAATTFATGLNQIAYTQVTVVSMTTAPTSTGSFADNKGESGTSIAGNVGMSNVVADAKYRFVVHGGS